jgi:hypothetical protein
MSRILLPRSLAVGLFAAACALALAACSPSPTPTPTASATPPAGTGTLGTVTPSASATAAAPAYPTDAGEYAKAAVAAWAARDIGRLDQLEVQDGELHTLYSCNGCYDVHFVLIDCQGAAGSSYCLFFNNVGDSLRLRLVNQFLGQPRAIGTGSIWDPITFPSDDKAYAQEALDAWQAGNDNRLKLLTQGQLTSAQVTALGPDHSGQWTYNPAFGGGAMGTIGFTWTDVHGHQLSFLFTNGPAAPTTGPNSQHRIRQIVYNP